MDNLRLISILWLPDRFIISLCEMSLELYNAEMTISCWYKTVRNFDYLIIKDTSSTREGCPWKEYHLNTTNQPNAVLGPSIWWRAVFVHSKSYIKSALA